MAERIGGSSHVPVTPPPENSQAQTKGEMGSRTVTKLHKSSLGKLGNKIAAILNQIIALIKRLFNLNASEIKELKKIFERPILLGLIAKDPSKFNECNENLKGNRGFVLEVLKTFKDEPEARNIIFLSLKRELMNEPEIIDAALNGKFTEPTYSQHDKDVKKGLLEEKNPLAFVVGVVKLRAERAIPQSLLRKDEAQIEASTASAALEHIAKDPDRFSECNENLKGNRKFVLEVFKTFKDNDEARTKIFLSLNRELMNDPTMIDAFNGIFPEPKKTSSLQDDPDINKALTNVVSMFVSGETIFQSLPSKDEPQIGAQSQRTEEVSKADESIPPEAPNIDDQTVTKQETPKAQKDLPILPKDWLKEIQKGVHLKKTSPENLIQTEESGPKTPLEQILARRQFSETVDVDEEDDDDEETLSSTVPTTNIQNQKSDTAAKQEEKHETIPAQKPLTDSKSTPPPSRGALFDAIKKTSPANLKKTEKSDAKPKPKSSPVIPNAVFKKVKGHKVHHKENKNNPVKDDEWV